MPVEYRLPLGSQLNVKVPIYISEYEPEWLPGRLVQVVEVNDSGYEIETLDGSSIGSFAIGDIKDWFIIEKIGE